MIRIDSNSDPKLVLQLCGHASGDLRPAAVNMDCDDWENKPNTLMHCIYKQKRFDGKGNGFFLYEKDGMALACAGYNVSPFDENMVAAMVRTYTVRGKNMWRAHREFMRLCVEDIEQDFKGFYSSYNQYNRNLLFKLHRQNLLENYRSSFVKDGKSYAWEGNRMYPGKLFGPIELNKTKQWIHYHLFDPDYEPTLIEKLSAISIP